MYMQVTLAFSLSFGVVVNMGRWIPHTQGYGSIAGCSAVRGSGPNEERRFSSWRFTSFLPN